MSYDALGRMTSRTEGEGSTSWTYDTAAKGKGKLHRVAGPGGYVRVHGYDSLGRAHSESETIHGETFGVSRSYDGSGRVATVNYPKAGFGVGRRYTVTGHLESVYKVGTPGTVYWTAGAVNAEGQTTEATLGNGVGTTRSYDAATGLVRTIQSGVGESSAVQDLGYRFDSLGNLTTREDFNQDVYESFAYDRLNRLTGGIVYDAEDDTERESKTYRYDAVGNIVNKSDVGAADYVYGTGNAAGAGDAGPHAVVSAGGNSYAYDDNGNMISGDGRTLTWTSFNKPKTVVNGTTHTRFDYGPERARTRQVKVQGATTTTIKYVGTLFEQVAKTGAATEYVHYVFAGERRVAVYAKDNAPTPREAVQYLHQDHLGSVDTITDESGGVVERLSYDAWGKRRTASGEDAWKDSAIPITAATTPRGFTDHEHLDDFELVHMNGRVYDPVLGRFLSPDPFVQYPESTQGFNRYTYVSNNPLSFVDPTGYEEDEFDNWGESTPDFDEGHGQDSGLGTPSGPSTDDEGGIGGWDGDWGQSTQVSNPATGGRVPTASGSPQGVNQAGHGGGDRRGMFSDYWEDMRELPVVTWDPVTDERIRTLHPRAQGPTGQFVNEVERETGMKLRVTDATRTLEEQEAKFQSCRERPGPIRTDAPPGESYHNYGLAIDVVEIRNGRAIYEDGNWTVIAEFGARYGFEWGGNWNTPDRPHFQITFGLSIDDLQGGIRP